MHGFNYFVYHLVSATITKAGIAQLGERQTEDLKVACSIHAHRIICITFFYPSYAIFLECSFVLSIFQTGLEFEIRLKKKQYDDEMAILQHDKEIILFI